MKATRLMRKPSSPICFEIVEEQLQSLAKWCGGAVLQDENSKQPYILVPVTRMTNPNQAKGFLGHYIVKAVYKGKTTFKVYRPEWLWEAFDTPEDYIRNGVEDYTPDDEIPDSDVAQEETEAELIAMQRSSYPVPAKPHPQAGIPAVAFTGQQASRYRP